MGLADRLRPVVGRLHPLVGRVVWWVAGFPEPRRLLERLAREIDEAAEARTGTAPTRSMYQMRVLPAGVRPPRDTQGPPWRGDVAYRPAVHEDRLLDLLQGAFAWHPEERWDRDRLHRELALPGTGPTHVRLLLDGNEPVAFCWTRLYGDAASRYGELVILGVDPARTGQGWGRRVVHAGLTHLWASGATWAYLYTDSTNLRAVRLYLDAGFTVYRTEHRYGQAPLTVP